MPNNLNHMICVSSLDFSLLPCVSISLNLAVSFLDGRQDPREHPGVELEVVEWPEQGQGVEQGAAHHHDQVVDRHHLELSEDQSE